MRTRTRLISRLLCLICRLITTPDLPDSRAQRLKKLVYVSCNPDTLASNMIDLCKPGGMGGDPFCPVKAMAVDLFPHTEHCEAVVMFER